MTRTSLILVTALALSACVPTEPENPVPSFAQTPDSPNAGPGTIPVVAALAAETFQSVCADQLPDFKAAPATLRSRGFAQNTTTGTFFHPVYDLSVKLIPEGGGGDCSMVFVSEDDATTLGAALRGAGGGATVVFPEPQTILGETYYRAVISAR
jgi:hypothetical protein